MDRYEEEEIDPVLRTVVNHWLTKLKFARDHKRKVFQAAADECLAFYNGPRDWNDLMGTGVGITPGPDIVEPIFKVSVNKTFELVTIFGPALYFENPVRTVKPRMPVVVPPQFFATDPLLYQTLLQQEDQRLQADGLRAVLLEAYLNWTPIEFLLRDEARAAVDEALIVGRGAVWTELYSPPGTDMKVVRSQWDSTNNLICDPDGPSFRTCKWIARRCVHPVWQVERDYGLRSGSIRGNLESQAKQADIETSDDQQYQRRQGQTNDLLIYWKIYSRMGIGGRLQGIRKELKDPLEIFGDYCYIVVAENIPFPLNLPPDLTTNPDFAADPQAVFDKVAWPTPFWAADEWPCTELDFHIIPNSTWPMPHLRSGMGELKFLNWAMSFLMGKIRNTSRDFIAVKKEAGEEIKTTILEGKDLTLLELEAAHGTISELVQFLSHPEVNGDIWKMIEAVGHNFDNRTGLTELMQGAPAPTQPRSAHESEIRNQNMNVRPDDMRKCVEAWMTRVGFKEALAARYHLSAPDVQPCLGAMGATAWDRFVATRDINEACRQLEYRIEAGSTARPNKNWEVQAMNTAFTALGPLLQAYSQLTGDMTPLNNILADFAKSLDLDPARYQLKQPVLAGPPGQPSGPPPSTNGLSIGHQTQATTNIPAPG